MSITSKELKRLRELSNAATPGPWKLWAMQVRWDKSGDSDVNKSVLVADTYKLNERGQMYTRDAEFIAAVRTALPALLDEVERLQLALIPEQGFVRGLQDRIDTLTNDNLRLREALEFYADEKNYKYIGRKGTRVRWDNGERARAALNEAQG